MIKTYLHVNQIETRLYQVLFLLGFEFYLFRQRIENKIKRLPLVYYV